MTDKKTGVGIIGCGNIAGHYAGDLKRYSQIDVVGVTDTDAAAAKAFADEHGFAVIESSEAMLADDRVELVLNLTPAQVHKDVIAQCLRAGKHVFSEKPLAMTAADATALVALAEDKGLRLGCAPSTALSEAQQTLWKCVRDGKIGRARVAYADMNHGRIETWHPSPGLFYAAGPVFDIGAYPLVLLTSIFGPARRVTATGKILLADRKDIHGQPIAVTAPDFFTANIEFDDDALARLTVNFFVDGLKKQHGIEVHGEEGSVHVESPWMFNAPVQYAPFGAEYQSVPLVGEPFDGVEWGRGLLEMVEAMAAGRPHRTSGRHAAHIVEIMCAIHASADAGQAVEIASEFDPPAPMDFAR